jgi:hypothetical protein
MPSGPAFGPYGHLPMMPMPPYLMKRGPNFNVDRNIKLMAYLSVVVLAILLLIIVIIVLTVFFQEM